MRVSSVRQEVATECAVLQKQVNVLQSVEQSQNIVAEWLQGSLEQLSKAVNTPPYSARLLELIASYQVCHNVPIFYSMLAVLSNCHLSPDCRSCCMPLTPDNVGKGIMFLSCPSIRSFVLSSGQKCCTSISHEWLNQFQCKVQGITASPY